MTKKSNISSEMIGNRERLCIGALSAFKVREVDKDKWFGMRVLRKRLSTMVTGAMGKLMDMAL